MKKSLLLLLSLTASVAFSQKIILKQGAPDALKGEKQIRIEYDYSSFGVGKFPTEKEYLDSKVADYNKDEAGRGDKFLASWNNDKATRFPAKFEQLFNEGTSKLGLTGGRDINSKYTLIVKTTFLEPGFNVGVVRKSAAVSFEYWIVESANHANVIAVLTQNEVPGAMAMGMDYDTGSRISESYAKGAKMLAAYLVKNLK